MNTNTIELADLLDGEFYTLGTTGKQAIVAMMNDVSRQFTLYPENSNVFGWLDNEDGTRATLADVIEAIALVARRYEDEQLMDKEIN